MFRKRRFDQIQESTIKTHEESIPSPHSFIPNLPPLESSCELATKLDVYHVSCAFLREGYEVHVISKEGKFHVIQLSKEGVCVVLLLICYGLQNSKVVVPLNVKMEGFTMELLGDMVSENLFLAFVAFDGSFTIYHCTKGIACPPEKPKL